VLTKNLIQERAALQSFDHPNIITLRYAFQDAAFWYLAMDYFPNGEVFTLLKKQPARRFSVAVVQTWAAMLLSALEHMHDKGFIHRDIKLENILMSRRNHAILMDFGLSVHLPTELAAGCTDLGFCGTPEYLAPEVIRSGLYGYEVDMWGLGIVIYELLVGYPPYFMTGRMTKDDLFRRIVCDPVPPSERLPSLAQDLVRRLLHKSPEKRLTADEMRQHPFFEGVDWDMVDRGTCPCIVLPTDASPLSPSPACVRQGATARSAQEPDSSDLQAHSGSESSEGEDSLKSLESAGSPSSFPSSPSSSNSGNLVGVLDFGVGDPLDPLDPLDPADGSQRSPSCLGSPGLVEMGTGQSSSSSSSSSSSMSTSILGPSRSRSHGCVRVINGGMKGYGDGGDGGSGEGGSGEGEGHGDGVGVGTLEAGKWGIQGRLTCSSTGVVVLHPQPSDALLSAISRQLPTPKARFKGACVTYERRSTCIMACPMMCLLELLGACALLSPMAGPLPLACMMACSMASPWVLLTALARLAGCLTLSFCMCAGSSLFGFDLDASTEEDASNSPGLFSLPNLPFCLAVFGPRSLTFLTLF
jgi:serine/threonine protein kinase